MKYIHNQKGAALLVTLLTILIFTVLGLSLIGSNINNAKQLKVREASVQATDLAEMGMALFYKQFSASFKKQALNSLESTVLNRPTNLQNCESPTNLNQNINQIMGVRCIEKNKGFILNLTSSNDQKWNIKSTGLSCPTNDFIVYENNTLTCNSGNKGVSKTINAVTTIKYNSVSLSHALWSNGTVEVKMGNTFFYGNGAANNLTFNPGNGNKEILVSDSIKLKYNNCDQCENEPDKVPIPAENLDQEFVPTLSFDYIHNAFKAGEYGIGKMYGTSENNIEELFADCTNNFCNFPVYISGNFDLDEDMVFNKIVFIDGDISINDKVNVDFKKGLIVDGNVQIKGNPQHSEIKFGYPGVDLDVYEVPTNSDAPINYVINVYYDRKSQK
ncbi:hypothetical protein [Pseudalkalibacillus caeni]|uniref:Type 4 fimbrial biogenesis protein PilX N-terminal domain-containing protein n=1 Tax=Exobacillus caeni TaxID=2574798 RepID=A0A5R9FAK4_9BACL|nr:hypothetical protein [Pseudalkalibacillus caeni]TLS39226.1 hypothetical protein FCL54_02660 [Pseudalkalibacillus caeni]